MRTFVFGCVLIVCSSCGCLKTEPMSPEELYKHPRPSPEQFAKDDSNIKQPRPETCLEGGKMLEALAKTTTEVTQQRDYSWRAKQAYQQALRLKPNWSAAIAGLARIEEIEGNPQSASGHFQQAVQLASGKEQGDAVACHEAGLFFGRIKQFDTSVSSFQKAVQLDPNNRTYAMNYGYALARASRFEEGYQHFSKIMNPSEAAYQMALMSQHMGDADRSRQFAGFALQQNPTHAQAQQLLARLDQPAVQQTQGVQP